MGNNSEKDYLNAFNIIFLKEMSLVEWDNTDIISRKNLLYTQLIAKGFHVSDIHYENILINFIKSMVKRLVIKN